MATTIERSQELSSPAIETALNLYGPKLTGILSGTIDPTKFQGSDFVEGQNVLQQEAAKQAFAQQGYNVSFNPVTGKPTISGSGIADFQSFLDDAGTAAGQIQGAGADALSQAEKALEQQQLLTQGLYTSEAASPFMQRASSAADAAQAAAAAGQGAGDADFAAARGFTGPGAYEQFMSPYQQEVIDATRADYEAELRRQQSQLGASAGSAFGGGRFGVAQGELGAQGARGLASTLAQLRQQGFTTANQLAAQAAAQRMGLGQAQLAQAAQNVGLFGQAGQLQSGLAGQAAGIAGQDLSALGQTAQMQSALAQSQMSPYQNALAANLQLAQATPQLGAQQFGVLSSFGDQQQKYAQAGIDAMANRNKLQQYAPYEQLGFVGQQISGLMGGYGTGTTVGSTQGPQPSSGESLASGLMSTSGILANLGSLFGQG